MRTLSILFVFGLLACSSPPLPHDADQNPPEPTCDQLCSGIAARVQKECVEHGGTAEQCQAAADEVLKHCNERCNPPPPPPVEGCKADCFAKAEAAIHECV